MKLRRWIATLGGAGFIHPAPGTWGSAVAAILAGLALWLAGPSAVNQSIAMIEGVVFFGALSVFVGNYAVQDFGRKDPGSFVLDEAAGIFLTLLFQPASTGWNIARNALVAFVAFRIFDITKPPPARQLEHLPGGWGILMDDLAAAVYANIACQLLLRMAFHH